MEMFGAAFPMGWIAGQRLRVMVTCKQCEATEFVGVPRWMVTMHEDGVPLEDVLRSDNGVNQEIAARLIHGLCRECVLEVA